MTEWKICIFSRLSTYIQAFKNTPSESDYAVVSHSCNVQCSGDEKCEWAPPVRKREEWRRKWMKKKKTGNEAKAESNWTWKNKLKLSPGREPRKRKFSFPFTSFHLLHQTLNSCSEYFSSWHFLISKIVIFPHSHTAVATVATIDVVMLPMAHNNVKSYTVSHIVIIIIL